MCTHWTTAALALVVALVCGCGARAGTSGTSAETDEEDAQPDVQTDGPGAPDGAALDAGGLGTDAGDTHDAPGVNEDTSDAGADADDAGEDVVEPAAFTVYDSGMFAATPALTSAGIVQDSLIYMVDCWSSATPNYAIVDTARATALGTAKRLAGVSRVIIDIEYLPNAPSSIRWWLQNEKYRASGIAGWLEFLDAFQLGYQHFGEVGVYDPGPTYIEVARKAHFTQQYSAEDVAAQKAWEDKWFDDIAPLMAVVDFHTVSVYGEWHTYAPNWAGSKAFYTEAVSYAIWEKTLPMIYTEYVSRYGADKPISWFFTTNQPNSGGSGFAEFPDAVLPWFFATLKGFLPATKRIVNMWQGPPPYRGYWTPAEVQTMIAFGQ